MPFDIPERGVRYSSRFVVASLLMLAAIVALVSFPAVTDAQDTSAVLPAPVDTMVRPVGPVRPGDVLQLRVFGEEGVSGDYIIDNDGIVTIPGIGTVRVANLAPRQARAVLDKEIRTRFS